MSSAIDRKLRFGINWSVDTRLGYYRSIFDGAGREAEFGAYLRTTFGEHFHIRYPGGFYVQRFNLNPSQTATDLTTPGPDHFLAFCRANGISVLHQLPTSAVFQDGSFRPVRERTSRSMSGEALSVLLQQAQTYLTWLKHTGYLDTIVAFEIGNEDYAPIEGAFSPTEYVEIVARYLEVFRQLSISTPVLINCRPAGPNNWGRSVLEQVAARGLINQIYGVATHVYPGWSIKRLQSGKVDFDQYCLGEDVLISNNQNYTQLVSALDDLRYPDRVQVFVTEFGIDLPGSDFQYTKKDMAAAIGLARNVMELLPTRRFGGLSYYCLFHKYLVGPEIKAPDGNKIYGTTTSDWGLGQLWYFPDDAPPTFVGTPLLLLLGLFSRSVNAFSKAGPLFLGPTLPTLLIAQVGQPSYFLLTLNLSAGEQALHFKSDSDLSVFQGGLDARTVPLGVRQIRPGTFKFERMTTGSAGLVRLPPFAVMAALFDSGTINGLKVDAGLVGFEGWSRSGSRLVLGTFGIRIEAGQLIPYPPGATIAGTSTLPISTDASVIVRVFGDLPEQISKWSVEPVP